MGDLKTRYLGLDLSGPVIAGASSLTADLETIRRIEAAGAGAVVTKSLFEEEIQLQRFKMEEDREKFSYRHPEMITIFPQLEHRGPTEHLYWVEKTRKALSIPLIASLNAVEEETWLDYARQLEETGVDALELNLYAAPEKARRSGRELEEEQTTLVEKITAAISIPVSVKLSFFYTSPVHFISRLDRAGIRGLVLFNRLFQPDIDIFNLENTFTYHLSDRSDHRLPLKFTGLLSGEIQGDICSSTGIFEAEDLIKMVLAGAAAVQVVSTLYRNGVDHIRKINSELAAWMKEKGYSSLMDFRGQMNRQNIRDPWVYTRAQYVKMLMNPRELLKNVPAP